MPPVGLLVPDRCTANTSSFCTTSLPRIGDGSTCSRVATGPGEWIAAASGPRLRNPIGSVAWERVFAAPCRERPFPRCNLRRDRCMANALRGRGEGRCPGADRNIAVSRPGANVPSVQRDTAGGRSILRPAAEMPALVRNQNTVLREAFPYVLYEAFISGQPHRTVPSGHGLSRGVFFLVTRLKR